MRRLPQTPETELGYVLARERLSQVAERGRGGLLGGLGVRVCGRVDGESLVVAEGVDGGLGEEAGVVHGAVVDDLHQGVVFVVYRCVVDVDQSVRAARQEDVGAARMELELAAVSVRALRPACGGWDIRTSVMSSLWLSTYWRLCCAGDLMSLFCVG
jgi:hypothetical protein